MFVFGFMAATSHLLFVVLAWGASVILLISAGLVWLAAQFFQRD